VRMRGCTVAMPICSVPGDVPLKMGLSGTNACVHGSEINLQHAGCLLDLPLEDGPLVEEDLNVPSTPVRVDSALVVVPYPDHREILQVWRV
jgi:hypothetical protein